MRQRPFRLLGDIDLSLLETLDQIVGREIDQLDGISAVEDGVWDGLAYAHMGNLSNDVIEAFDVLNVDRRINVDAMAGNLFDVEIALRMSATGRVGVSKLIDKNNLRSAFENGVEVHFLEPLPLIINAPTRDDLETLEQRFRFLAPVGLDDADDDVVPVPPPGTGRLQHLVGLADAGRRTDEDPDLADAPLLPPRGLQQGLRRRSLIRIAPLICHPFLSSACYLTAARSSARFSANTLTRGSPNTPRYRPCVWS